MNSTHSSVASPSTSVPTAWREHGCQTSAASGLQENVLQGNVRIGVGLAAGLMAG